MPDPNTLILDGIDLFDDLGLVIDSLNASRDGRGPKLAEGQSPFSFRRFNIGRQATSSLPITFEGVISTPESLSPAAAHTEALTRLDRLKWRLRQQKSHSVEWADDPSRFWDIEFEDLRVRGFARDFRDRALRVDLKAKAFDPRAKSTTETTLDGAPSPPDPAPITLSIIPLGTAPIDAVVTIEGNTASPLLTGWELEYRDESDVVVKSLIWDGQDLDSADIVVIDLADATVELNGANAIDDLRSGSDLPILLDPNDGADDSFLDQIAAKVPDIRLSGTGDVDQFAIVYRARFW